MISRLEMKKFYNLKEKKMDPVSFFQKWAIVQFTRLDL